MNIENFYNYNNIKVAVLGDFMLDNYICGKANRISPEAPVPVLKIDKKMYRLGGAGNVINNVCALGAEVKVMGVIGDDSEGKYILQKLEELKVDTKYLMQTKEIGTSVKTRITAENHQYIRLDEEEIFKFPCKEEQILLDNVALFLSGVDVAIISDYGKGAVSINICQSIIDYCNLSGIKCIVDPKGDNYEKYIGVMVCTPNVKELAMAVGRELKEYHEIVKAGLELKNNYKIKILVLTRSEKGILLFNENNKIIDFPAQSQEIIDVTGAGDTVVAMLSIALCKKYSIEEACILANEAASLACSKFGTSVISLIELYCKIGMLGNNKILNKHVASNIVKFEKKNGKTVVFTNGCFDMLHVGHLSSFERAKKFGDILIVAINSDESVKKIKGDLRPIIKARDRMRMVCALECVDFVILMEEDNPSQIIKCLEPNIVVKGKDWEDRYMPEKTVIEHYGGEVRFIEIKGGVSTSNIIDKLKRVIYEE